MDSAIFIRKHSVFIAWLIVPLVLIILTYYSTALFTTQQNTLLSQCQMLQKIIPKMTAAAISFNEETSPYALLPDKNTSIEDINIALFNDVAEQTGFSITSINLAQKTGEELPGIVQIEVNINGEGSSRELIAFIKEVKTRDPFIYENNVLIFNSGNQKQEMELEATFNKLYIHHSEIPL